VVLPDVLLPVDPEELAELDVQPGRAVLLLALIVVQPLSPPPPHAPSTAALNPIASSRNRISIPVP
jgi:hypothetical protein